MIRLIRNNNVCGAASSEGIEYTDYAKMVPIEKLRDLLPHIKQLRKSQLSVGINKFGELIIIVDGIKYETRS